MLKCNYYKKSEISGYKELIEEFDPLDTNKCAKQLGVSYPIVKLWASQKKEDVDIRVPQLFIDLVITLISEKKNNLKELNQKIEEL